MSRKQSKWLIVFDTSASIIENLHSDNLPAGSGVGAEDDYHRSLFRSRIRDRMGMLLSTLLLVTCLFWMWGEVTWKRSKVERTDYTVATILPTFLHPTGNENLEKERVRLIAEDRAAQIKRVTDFFTSYGSPLVPYASIFVDQSVKCGGNYRVLVGIAGSESGLGRINVKKYNPFGYLDGVQYASFDQAITILACKVSQQHISKCGEDLQCLYRRYAGPADDPNLFISKVKWFMDQV